MSGRGSEPATADTGERSRRIQAALDDFYEMLATVPVVGVAHWSELDRLAELIGRHPEAARRILDRDAPTDTGGPEHPGAVRRG